MNTVEAEVCRHENEVRVPCEIGGQVCGSEGEGHCVAHQLCCNDGKIAFITWLLLLDISKWIVCSKLRSGCLILVRQRSGIVIT